MSNVLRSLALVLVLAACGTPGEVNEEGWLYVGKWGYVKDIVTPAGVRCVVYDGDATAGLSCDWSQR